jgi:lysozyme
MRAVNALGLAFIKKEEGLRLTAYRCKAGKLTIGYGHTGPDVFDGMNIPAEVAERLFLSDIQKHSLGLERYVSVLVTPNQWAALVSLAFNMGITAIGTSTLVRKLNAGEVVTYDGRGQVVGGAAAEFLRWKYVDRDPTEARDMVPDPALLARRERELVLFLTGVVGPRVA